MIVPCRLQGFSSVPQLSPIKVIVSVFAEIMSFCSRSGKLRTVRYKIEKKLGNCSGEPRYKILLSWVIVYYVQEVSKNKNNIG